MKRNKKALRFNKIITKILFLASLPPLKLMVTHGNGVLRYLKYLSFVYADVALILCLFKLQLRNNDSAKIVLNVQAIIIEEFGLITGII